MAEEEPGQPRSPWPVIILLGVIFLPGGILAFLLWGMLRWGKQRPSVVALAGGIVAAFAAIIAIISFSGISSGVAELSSEFSGDKLGATAMLLIPLWLCVSLILGAFAGWSFALYSSRQMKKNPYLTELAGSWRYQFEYRRTPIEYFRRQKNIRALKNALYVEEEAAPLGLDEKTDDVVYRYDTEARKHTFMTGASGSGKALHAMTWIPTTKGFKRAGRIREGDVLWAPNGRPTAVKVCISLKRQIITVLFFLMERK